MQLHPYYIQFTALAAALTTLGQRIHVPLVWRRRLSCA